MGKRGKLKHLHMSVLLCCLLLAGSGCAKNSSQPDGTLLNTKPTGALSISINQMIELDFMKKTEVYAIRKEYIFKDPQLVKAFNLYNYKPDEFVFGQIQDGKPWWGILGLSYYGNKNNKGIEGLSEESRFIINPFILIGIDEGIAHITNGLEPWPEGFYPKPISLYYDIERMLGWVTYDLTDFFQKDAMHHDKKNNTMDFIAYNARDLGFQYIYIVHGKEINLKLNSAPNEIIMPGQFIHTGGSCGYPGGCNNMSPYIEALTFKVNFLPARAYFKLWRKKPDNYKRTPDAWFVVEMI